MFGGAGRRDAGVLDTRVLSLTVLKSLGVMMNVPYVP